jgi:hypothetical protein
LSGSGKYLTLLHFAVVGGDSGSFLVKFLFRPISYNMEAA